MAMDMIRKTFVTKMYFWLPPQAGRGQPAPSGPITPEDTNFGSVGLGAGASGYPVPVRWYYCQPGARFLPFPNAFVSAGWDMEGEWNSPLGDINEHGRFLQRVRNVTPTTATGQRSCNSPREWSNGQNGPSVLPVRYDNQGIPFCCGTQVNAPAAGNLGLLRRIVPQYSAIGQSAAVPSGGAICVSMPSVAPVAAAGNIGFAGFLPALGSLILGEIIPPYGDVAFATIGIAEGAFTLGEPVPEVPSIVIGAAELPIGSVVLGEPVPEVAPLGLGGQGFVIGGVILGGVLPSGNQLVYNAPDLAPLGDIGLARATTNLAPIVVTSSNPKSPEYVPLSSQSSGSLVNKIDLFNINYLTGKLIVTVWSAQGAVPTAVPTCTFNGTSMTLVKSLNPAGAENGMLSVFHLNVTAGTGGHVQCVSSTTAQEWAFLVGEAIGLASNLVDTFGFNSSATGTPPITATMSPVQPGPEVMVASVVVTKETGGPDTWSNGYQPGGNVSYTYSPGNQITILVGWRAGTPSVTESTTMSGYTAGDSWGMVIQAYY
jgi:hypothetical protein